MKDEKWMKYAWMKRNVTNDLLLSLSVSFFGLLLIFGLGFVFPNINPYIAIKWIVIVGAVFFVYALLSFLYYKILKLKMQMGMGMMWKMPSKAKKASKK